MTQDQGDQGADVDGSGAMTQDHGEGDVEDLGVFVDRLAAAGSDRPTALAAEQVRRWIEAGAVPAGLRRLAEALATSVAEPPAQRRPADEPGSVVAAMAVRSLVVLADHGPAEVADAVAALLAEGRRVVVTGPAADRLGAIRSALPEAVADRVVPRLPAVLPAELRELRKLLVTDTSERRSRIDQELPPESGLPPVAQVALLCARARGFRPGGGGRLLGDVLDDADPERLTAIAGVAGCVRTSLAALGPYHQDSWTWNLLADLVIQRHRGTFDRLCEEVAQAVGAAAVIDRALPVIFVEPLTEHGVQALFSYLDYLRSGGRARGFFRPVEQREVQPVLGGIRVGGQVPQTAADVELVLSHRELFERSERIDRYCAEIGVPPLRMHVGLPALAEDLGDVAAAARSMAALRHDVLFLRADSPIAPPDVTDAQQIAGEILSYLDREPTLEAEGELDRLADALASAAPAPASASASAPEHDHAVAALRARDGDAYAAAVDAMGAARRQIRDNRRQAALLARLRSAAPALAAAWAGGSGFGLACFVSADTLLTKLPPADSADVVIVVGAAGLGVERLLLAAVAPRIVAVAAPGESSDRTPSLLTVLRRAGALVIRGATDHGRVVPLARTVPAPREAPVG